MTTISSTDAQRLLQFNGDVIDQALALVAQHEVAGRADFADPVGAHLRHVVEHYDALLSPAEPRVVDYDQRARDRALECSTALMAARLRALQQQLRALSCARLNESIEVRGQTGLAGEFEFSVASSVGRELVFVAGHAIHHFALLQGHCRQHGIPTGAAFGKAPATVAHERATVLLNPSTRAKDLPCPAPLTTA
jgi:hypothetical protein